METELDETNDASISNEDGSIESTINYIDDIDDAKQSELMELGKQEKRRFTEPEEGVMLWMDSIDDGIISTGSTHIKLVPSKSPDKNTGYLGVVIFAVNSSQMEAEQNISGIPMTLISNIISVNVYEIYNEMFNEISDVTVTITMSTNVQNDDNQVRVCCFLNETTLHWSTDGCLAVQLKTDSTTSTTCVCNHLTSFAILMRVEEPSEVEEANEKALSILTLIGISISTVFLVLILITTCTLPELRKCERFIVLRHIVISLLCVNVSFICLSVKPKQHVLCSMVAVCLHYSLLVAFLWMVLWCTDLYCKIKHAFSDHERRFKYFRFIGWLSPVMVVATTVVAAREEYATQRCWLNTSNGVIWTFIVPVILAILSVTIQLAVVFFEAYKKAIELPSSHHDEHLKLKKLRSTSYRVLMLAPVVGLPWVTGLFVIIDDSMFLQFIFIFSASLQGLWIWLTQFCLSREVRDAFKKHCGTSSNTVNIVT